MSSGINWCERYLATAGFIGENVDRSITALWGIFAYLEVKNGFIMPGGFVLQPHVWEIQIDNVAPGESTVRLDYTSNPNVTATDQFDFVFNVEGTEDVAAANDQRMFFIGNPNSVGAGSFRAGRCIGTEWDAANRGDNSIAMGVNVRAAGGNSAIIGGGAHAVSALDSGIFVGSGNTINDNAGIGSNTNRGAIVGGILCVMGDAVASSGDTNDSVIAGCRLSSLWGNNNAIVGGEQHTIRQNGASRTQSCAIVGGSTNTIGTTGQTATCFQCGILGGFQNQIICTGATPGHVNCVIAGGVRNTIDDTGGGGSQVGESGIIAGADNRCAGQQNVIVGGSTHTITSAAINSAIIGGDSCTMTGDRSVIAGGSGLTLNQNDTLMCQRFQHTGGIQCEELDAVAAASTMTEDNYVFWCDAAALGVMTVDMPAAPVSGQTYIIKKTAQSANSVTIQGNGNNIADVDGTVAATLVCGAAGIGGVVTMVFDGANSIWEVLTNQ